MQRVARKDERSPDRLRHIEIDTEFKTRKETTMSFLQRPGMKRGLLAAGALLGVFTLITAATLTDFANVNLGSNGFAPASDYNIQVSSSKETALDSVAWVEGDDEEGTGVNITNEPEFTLAMQSMEPGDALIFVIPVRNASEDWASTLSVNFKEVQSESEATEDDDGILAAKDAFIKALELSHCMTDTPLSECDEDGDFSSAVTLTGENTSSAPVELIGDASPLAAYDTADVLYNSGAGNATFVVVKVKLAAGSDLADFIGGDADIQVQFTGESVA
ncbi:MAG: hypothetical protein ACTILK_07440 [Bifidobacterium crudilactis]|uniref:hypothetical protein n=1 Tax=Bifidobacterium crudilactis TaxID=327277 RepID=UPI003F94E1AA